LRRSDSVRCGAGCTTAAVCDALDHNLADLFFDPDEPWVELGLDGGGAPTAPPVGVPCSPGKVTSADGAAESGEDAADLRHAVYAELLGALN